MIGAIKTIGTALTVAQTAQFGKELYSKYQTKKRKKQVEEVHNFIKNIDMEKLEYAIQSKDNDALIDAVEEIMSVAESIKLKNDFEAFRDEAIETTRSSFEKFQKIARDTLNQSKDQKRSESKTDKFQDFLNGKTIKIQTSKGPKNVSRGMNIVTCDEDDREIVIVTKDSNGERKIEVVSFNDS